MKTRTRTQVYWRDGRLHPVTNTRPTGLGPWPRIAHFHADELVAIVEGDTGHIEITEGPAATSERVDNAFLLHRGVEPESVSHQVWARVPATLRASIEARVRSAENAVSDQWGQFSNEEAATGAFFSRLNDSFRESDWGVNISFVEFSKQTKEPQTGTDVAVVIDALTVDGQRSFKTMWFQAKSSQTTPIKSSSPPRMASQIPLAQTYCQASYGLIYTPQGIFVLGKDGIGPQPFHTTLDRCMQCHIGDTSVAVLKNSLNRKKLLQVVITEGNPPPRRRINLRRG